MDTSTLSGHVQAVLAAERNYVASWTASQRENRLRALQEAELASRLRHRIGGLDVFLASRGEDIWSQTFQLQVKFPSYWHFANHKPQPVNLAFLEEDLRWVIKKSSVRRHLVLYLPRRELGYNPQKKSTVLSDGCRRFQHVCSTTDASLRRFPLLREVLNGFSERVRHANSFYRQYRDEPHYNRKLKSFALTTVGDPAADLVWALLIAPLGGRTKARRSP